MARKKIKIFLDEDKPIERKLLEDIERLKRQRRFTPTLRIGMILALTLDEGDTTELRALFPEIVTALQSESHATQLAELRAEIAEMRLQLAQQQLAVANATTFTQPVMPDAPTLSAHKPQIKRSRASSVAQNLMASLDAFE